MFNNFIQWIANFYAEDLAWISIHPMEAMILYPLLGAMLCVLTGTLIIDILSIKKSKRENLTK